MIESILQAIQTEAVHTAEVVGYATVAIAIFEHYTGVGPKQLTGRWQLVPALVLTIGGLFAFALDDGLALWLAATVAIVNGSLAGYGSNLVHRGAQVVGGKRKRSGKGAVTLGSLVFLALMLTGCGILRTADDALADVCKGYMAAQPEVEAQAKKRAVSPFVVAEAVCMAWDAGHRIWELFQVQAPEPGLRTASPESQLEQAKDRALTVAKRQGILTE